MYLQEHFKNKFIRKKSGKKLYRQKLLFKKRNVYGGPSKKEMNRMIKNRQESFRKEEDVFEKEKTENFTS